MLIFSILYSTSSLLPSPKMCVLYYFLFASIKMHFKMIIEQFSINVQLINRWRKRLRIDFFTLTCKHWIFFLPSKDLLRINVVQWASVFCPRNSHGWKKGWENILYWSGMRRRRRGGGSSHITHWGMSSVRINTKGSHNISGFSLYTHNCFGRGEKKKQLNTHIWIIWDPVTAVFQRVQVIDERLAR